MNILIFCVRRAHTKDRGSGSFITIDVIEHHDFGKSCRFFPDIDGSFCIFWFGAAIFGDIRILISVDLRHYYSSLEIVCC